MVFLDRQDAGQRLGAVLRDRELGHPGTIVAGIPRGGVVVAAEVARELGVPLRAIVARKLGAPRQPELAIGALGPDGAALLDESLVVRLRVDEEWLEQAVAAERAELASRTEQFPGVVTAADVDGRVVIVVDDGVATGATAAAVGVWLGHAQAARRVLALPVGAPATLQRLERVYEEVVVLAQPRYFMAVGQWYRNFSQTTDAEVMELLSAHA
ncbi:MAG: phosphoribosyltransferase [Acidimicrobiia bacterium]